MNEHDLPPISRFDRWKAEPTILEALRQLDALSLTQELQADLMAVVDQFRRGNTNIDKNRYSALREALNITESNLRAKKSLIGYIATWEKSSAVSPDPGKKPLGRTPTGSGNIF